MTEPDKRMASVIIDRLSAKEPVSSIIEDYNDFIVEADLIMFLARYAQSLEVQESKLEDLEKVYEKWKYLEPKIEVAKKAYEAHESGCSNCCYDEQIIEALFEGK